MSNPNTPKEKKQSTSDDFNLTEAILQFLKDNPQDFTVSQIAKQIGSNKTKVQYIIQPLVDLKQDVPTRRSSNAQMYKFKDYTEKKW